MTAMDVLRSTVAPSEDDEPRVLPEWVVPLVAGAVTAGATAAVVIVTAMLAATAPEGTSVGAGQAVGVGAALWALAGGARLAVGGAVVAFTPLLAFALLTLVAAHVAGRTVPEGSLRASCSWVGGYAVGAGAACLLTLLGPVRPTVLSVVLPVLVVPTLGVVLARRGGHDAVLERLPRVLVRGLRPGLEGAAVLIGLGTLAVVAAVALSWERVGHVTTQLDAGGGGVVLLSLAQLLALPNAALWVVSFAAGPGFSVTDGAQVAWSGSESALMPMVPALAALPDPGAFPWAVHLLVLVPVLVGGFVGHRVLLGMPRLSPSTAKASAALAGVAVTAVAVGVVDAVGGGALGGERLSDIGAPASVLALVLFGEGAVAALVVVARDVWSLRR